MPSWFMLKISTKKKKSFKPGNPTKYWHIIQRNNMQETKIKECITAI